VPQDWLNSLNDSMDIVAIVGEAQAAALRVAELVSLSDPSDVPILGAAIQCGADVLVSGDRRAFGNLFGSRVGDLQVLTLRDVLLRVLRDRT
jgi:predicted nucleic acid-binding protein